MGILLVTAYTRMVEQGRQTRCIQSYSKYSRQPRVRTARLASLLGSPLWSGWRGISFLDHQTAPILPVMPWWWTHVIRHRL